MISNMECIQLSEWGIEAAARKAAAALTAGGIVLYPTDTLYGLGADVANPAALAELNLLKGREEGKPMSVIVPDIASMERVAVVNATAKKLAEQFLPGALTLVLRARGGGTVGVRIPDDPFALALARIFGKPYTATSANRAGEQTPQTISDILAHFGSAAEHLSLVVDGGVRESAKPSTVVSCVSDVPEILREGVITKKQLDL